MILNFGIVNLWLYYRSVNLELSRKFLVDPSRGQVGHPWNNRPAYISLHNTRIIMPLSTINKAAYQHYKSRLLLPLPRKKLYDKVTRIIVDCDECSIYWQKNIDFLVNIWKTLQKHRKHYHHHLWPVDMSTASVFRPVRFWKILLRNSRAAWLLNVSRASAVNCVDVHLTMNLWKTKTFRKLLS